MVLLVALGLAPPAGAVTVTYQQDLNGYTGTRDTFIKQSVTGSNFGAAVRVEWDGEDGGGMDFGLVRFEGIFGNGANQITPTDQVTSATLVYIVDNPGNTGSLHEVTVDWDPAVVTYDTFGDDAGVQADEYGALVGSAPGLTGINSIDVTAGIAAWALDPSANRGWIVRPTGGTDGVQFHSAESTTPTSRVKLVVVLNEGPAGQKVLNVKHTPYLQLGDAPLASTGPGIGDTDQIVIVWQTVETGSVGTPDDYFEVEYRQVGAGAYTAAGPVQPLDTGTQTRVNHSVTITGLAYHTDYEYRVFHRRNPGSPVTVATYTGTFQTRLAAADSTSFTFAAYGDSAYLTDPASMARFESVMARVTTIDAAFVSLLGDNIYDLGTHTAFDARFDPTVAPIQTAYVRNHIEYFCNGNHDAGGPTHGVPSLDNYYCPVPVQGVTSPVAAPAGETPEFNFSFDYGLVHFTVIDSTAWGGVQNDDGVIQWVSPARQAAISAWLQADLQASSLPWTVVCTHHPPVATLDKSDQVAMANTIIPILVNNDVDLLLVGHAHNYQRSYPLTGYSNGAQFTPDASNLYEKGDHVIEVVAGTGGRDIRGGTPGSAATWLQTYFSDTNGGQVGPLIVDVTPDEMHVKFTFASDGSIRDEFRIITPGPRIVLDPEQIAHTVFLGDSPANDQFTVTNGGPDVLNYSVNDNVGWLDVTPTAGDSTGEADPIDIIYTDVESLPVGQHVATITVTSPDAANSPEILTVTINVETVSPDFDGDADVDLDDYGHLQECFLGNVTQSDPDCQDALLTGDSLVNENDLTFFMGCFSGKNVIVDATCDD
jgi:hypothetical protein